MSEALAALGAAAAAGQFVEQGLKIAKFLHGTITAMKDAPAIISTRLQHVQQLIAIAQMIIQNPCFQTESIEATLETCLQRATKLHEMLLKVSPPENAGRRQQWKSAALAFLNQDEVETAFSDLDRQKVLLSLCMQTANAGLVRDIGIHTRVVSSRLGAVSIVVEDTAKDVKSIREILPGLPSQITTITSQLDGISSDFSVLADKLGSMSLAESPPVIQGFFNIPRRRSQQFIGREDTIGKIQSTLATQPRGRDAKVLVVRGIGGQGKTQLALEVCRRTQNNPFTSILWLDASSEEALQHGFEIIYERTRRQQDARLTSPEAIVSHVFDCLKRPSRLWLLVLDNLNNPATFASIRDYLPDDGNASVLITTRHARVEAYATDCNVVKLQALSPSEAVDLLLVSAKLQDNETVPRHEADAIVDRLACHPLAIRQAGAFIHRKRLPLSQFVAQLESHLVEVLSLDAAMEYIANSSAGDAVTTLSVLSTWELSFEHLKEEDNSKQHKADLLTLLAFWPGLAVSEAPLGVFCSNIEPWDSPQAMDDAPGCFLGRSLKAWDSNVYCNMLEELYSLALIEDYQIGDDGAYTVSFHPLVREWIRLRVPQDQALEYKILVSEVMTEYLIPSVSPDEHAALRTGPLSEEYSTNNLPGSADLIRELRDLQLDVVTQAGLYSQTDRIVQGTRSIAARAASDRTAEELNIEYHFARNLYDMGRYEEAQMVFQSLILSDFESVGLEPSECLWYVEEYFALCLSGRKGRHLQKARTMFEARLARATVDYGGDSVKALSSMHHLASVLHYQGLLVQAEQMQRQVLDLTKRVNGPTHPHALRSLHNVGRILTEQGKMDEAKTVFRECLDARIDTLGDSHLDTLETMSVLAALLAGSDEAHMLLEKAVKGLTEGFGEEHPSTKQAIRYLGICYQSRGELDLAEQHARRALELDSAVVGGDYGVLVGMALLASVHRDSGRLSEAERLLREAIADCERKLGGDSTLMIKLVADLGNVLQRMKGEAGGPKGDVKA